MRWAPVACALLLACGSKSDKETPPSKQPAQPEPPAPNVPQRTAIDEIAAVLPNVGALPLPKELGEDPVFVLADGVYDRDPTGEPVVALTNRALPGTDPVVGELLPLFDDRTNGQRVKPFGVDLYVHRDTPFLTFARIVATAREAGFGRFLLGVKNHDGVRRMPLNIPDEGTEPLDLVVSVTRDHLRVWSRSGKHGTADDPAIELPAASFGTLASQLDGLVPRDNKAPLPIQIAPDVPFQSVVLVIAALRPIAPDVLLDLPAR